MNDSKLSEFASQTRLLRRARLPLFLVLVLNVGLVARIPLTQAAVETAAAESESLIVSSDDPQPEQIDNSPTNDAEPEALSPAEMAALDLADHPTETGGVQPVAADEEPVIAKFTGVEEEPNDVAADNVGEGRKSETSPSIQPTVSASPEETLAAKTPAPETLSTKTATTKPATEPKEQPTDYIILRNPTSVAVFFVIDRNKTVALFPAQERKLSCRDKRLVEFHRGSDHGDAAFRLKPGRYDFTLSKDHGWGLIGRSS